MTFLILWLQFALIEAACGLVWSEIHPLSKEPRQLKALKPFTEALKNLSKNSFDQSSSLDDATTQSQSKHELDSEN